MLAMSAPLSVCTEEEQRAVIRFLWSEGVLGAEIYRRLSDQYGDNCMSKRSVYHWIDHFKAGRTSVSHQEGAGRPRTSTGSVNIERAEEMVMEDRRTTVDMVAVKLGVSHGSAHNILHNELGFRKVSARWVPRQLTETHKDNRRTISQRHLQRYENEGDDFLVRIITGDETWVHHFEPESKRQSMTWKHPDSPVPKKFKTRPSAGKLMLTVFWDSRGPILEHYTERGSTVTSDRYCEMLRHSLRPAIRTKRRGLLSRGVILLHDNARPHSAAKTLETLQELRFEVLEHPPYSPDLAPSDFHLFGPLKEALRGRRFSSDEEVKDAVHEWLSSMPNSFFSEGIQQLVHRWTKCLDRDGDYVEK